MTATAIPKPHPIDLSVGGDLERSRLTVFFRPLLVIPHIIVFYVWALFVLLAFVVSWPVALVMGRLPDPLHRFLAAYVRFQTGWVAYMYLLSDAYPPFAGTEGSYEIDVHVAPAARQSRAKVFFRMLLGQPAALIAVMLQLLRATITFLAWFYCMFTGRMHEGFQSVGAWSLRYEVQLSAYVFLLTDRYPALDLEPVGAQTANR